MKEAIQVVEQKYITHRRKVVIELKPPEQPGGISGLRDKIGIKLGPKVISGDLITGIDRSEPKKSEISEKKPQKIKLGETKFIYGNLITAIDRSRPEQASDVSVHEGIHGVLDGDPKMMTRVPGEGYDGLTIPSMLTAKSALGPDSLGHKGTSWDKRVAESTGENLAGAAAAAKSEAMRQNHRIMKVASALDKEGTIFNARYRQLIKEADEEKADIERGETTVFIKKRSGEVFSIKARVGNNEAEVPINSLS